MSRARRAVREESDMADKPTKAEQQRDELTAKIAGILGSQQAQDAGIISASVIEGEAGTVGVEVDENGKYIEYFVTVETA